MSILFSRNNWQVERGDYGYNVSRVALNRKTAQTYATDHTYHGTLEQAIEKLARHVADDEANTLTEYVISLRATMAELRLAAPCVESVGQS